MIEGEEELNDIVEASDESMQHQMFFPKSFSGSVESCLIVLILIPFPRFDFRQPVLLVLGQEKSHQLAVKIKILLRNVLIIF